MLLPILFSLLFIAACDKQQTLPPDDLNSDESEIIVNWKLPLAVDTAEAIPAVPIVYNNILIFGGFPLWTEGGRIMGYNLLSNEIIWEDACDLNIAQTSSIQYQNIFVALNGSIFTAYDLNNGNQLWTSPAEGGNKITNYENKIFGSRKFGGTPALYSYLIMADINTGDWDTLFTLDLSDGYGPNIHPPGVMINLEGDTILYFQNRQYNFDESDGKVDLYALDITKDSLLWVQYDIDPEGNSSVKPPLVYDNKIYFRGSRTIFCLDAFTGSILWQKDIGIDEFEDLLSSNSLIVDGKLIVKTSGYYLYALNPGTGSEIWVNPNAGPTPTDMLYYNGALYYGSAGDGMIHVMDAQTGDAIIEFESPAENDIEIPNAGFYNAVAIDPASNNLFTSDGYYLYCITIDW